MLIDEQISVVIMISRNIDGNEYLPDKKNNAGNRLII